MPPTPPPEPDTSAFRLSDRDDHGPVPEPGAPSGDGRQASTPPDPIRAALAQLTEGVIIADAGGRITFVNEAAARLHGVARLDVAPDAYAETYHLLTEDGRPYPSTHLPLARAVLRGETVLDARWRIRRPDGTEIFAVGSARPIRSAEGTQVGSVLTIRDDSAREAGAAAERERTVLAERLRAAFDQTPVGTVVFDAAGYPIAANPAFERLWGAGMADVPPSYSVLTDPQLEAAGALPLIRRAFAGTAVSVPPLRYDAASAVGRGRTLWTKGHLYPVRDATGTVVQVVLTHEDVTATIEAEAALRASEGRYRALVEATAEVVWTTDVDGAIEDMPAWRRLTGQTVDEVRGWGWLDAVHVDDRARVSSAWAQALETRTSYSSEYRVCQRDGSYRWYSARGVPVVNANGSIREWVGVCVDVDERRAQEQVLLDLNAALAAQNERLHDQAAELERRTAEAQAASLAKSEFLAVMSHELRTPLTAIGGYAEMIALGLRGPVTVEQREDLDRVRRAQRHLCDVINDVLDVAQIESGRVTYTLQPVLVSEFLAGIGPLIEPQARSKSISYECQPCDADAAACADPGKLRQLVLNLLSNAVKFTPVGGYVHVSCAVAADTVTISVRDTGIGIPTDKFDAIFQPFVQLDQGLTRTAEGTGLGLAISREWARGMGGEITVASGTGVGSTLTLRLPRA